jgi:hypothetical protein
MNRINYEALYYVFFSRYQLTNMITFEAMYFIHSGIEPYFIFVNPVELLT